MKYFRIVVAAWALCHLVMVPAMGATKKAARPPVIRHDPVTTAVRGQSMAIRAVVTTSSGSVKAVNLFYTTSRDAAPFKIAMQNVGSDSYFGSIPAHLLKDAVELSYYLEALDELDEATETRWYTVKLQNPQAAANQAIPSAAPAPKTPAEIQKDSWSWKSPAVIAGGTAVVVGGALLAAKSGGSSSDSSGNNGGGTTTTNAGTFVGTATKSLQLGGGVQTTSYPITISVTTSGTVATDNLHQGSHMEAQLSGTYFQMSAQVTGTNTGLLVYSGTLQGTMISGSISGSITTPAGANGSYSGVFSASKQ